jgi:hypothetical protein
LPAARKKPGHPIELLEQGLLDALPRRPVGAGLALRARLLMMHLCRQPACKNLVDQPGYCKEPQLIGRNQ